MNNLESKSFGHVYCFTNKSNGKCYIGQAVDFERRKNRHLYDALNNNDNYYFHNAIRKYGEENFGCTILCECNSKEELNEKEKYYIKILNTKVPNGYNLTDGGEGMSGYKHTDEAKKKMSENTLKKYGKDNPFYGKHHTDETKRKISKSEMGKKLSDETKQKISKANTGKNISDKHKKVLSCINKGKNNPNAKLYEITHPNGDIEIIKCLTEWCKKMNFNYNSVYSQIYKNKIYNGYKINKINDGE